MAAPGEFEIETHPGLGRRMMVAAGIALGLLVAGLIASACARAAEPLSIAVTPGPLSDIVGHAAKLSEQQGQPVKVVVFSDWVTPNVAVNEGSVEANFYEHKPFLAVAIKQRGFNLVAVAPGVVTPIGLFSHKVKSIAAVPEGGRAAVANDPVNRARGLQLFAKAGLITLKPGVGDAATVHDIIANPKHLRFIELPAPQLVRALDDVDIAQVSYTFLIASHGDPKTALITDGAGNDHYALQFVTRPQDAHDPKLLAFIKVFQSDEERAYIAQKYGDAFLPAW